jgi:hypothetical protein
MLERQCFRLYLFISKYISFIDIRIKVIIFTKLAARGGIKSGIKK